MILKWIKFLLLGLLWSIMGRHPTSVASLVCICSIHPVGCGCHI
uniref:Uncharacterized protein n=1 Tax=Rhizophora mucronata TaxID=61149 RepID=A0A2P2N7R6_RHIMU